MPGQPITLINVFDVPRGEEQEFLDLWRRVNSHARSKPGYVGHALHRSLHDTDTRVFYINVAQWASQEHFTAALDDRFRELTADPGWAPFPSTPGLYEVVDRG